MVRNNLYNCRYTSAHLTSHGYRLKSRDVRIFADVSFFFQCFLILQIPNFVSRLTVESHAAKESRARDYRESIYMND